MVMLVVVIQNRSTTTIGGGSATATATAVGPRTLSRAPTTSTNTTTADVLELTLKTAYFFSLYGNVVMVHHFHAGGNRQSEPKVIPKRILLASDSPLVTLVEITYAVVYKHYLRARLLQLILCVAKFLRQCVNINAVHC